VKLVIWDTADQERFGKMPVNYYKDIMGVILAYSIADRNTFK
jgi:GTPase SAR1 family protein